MTITAVTSFSQPKEHFFSSNLKYLRLVGLWPDDNWSPRRLFLYNMYDITLHAMSVFYLIITGIGTHRNHNDTVICLSNLDKSIVAYDFTMKAFFFVRQRKKFLNLITEIESSGDKVSEKRRTTMLNLIIIITMLCTAIALVFCVISLYNGEVVVETWLPFDPEKSQRSLFLALQIQATSFLPSMFRSIALQCIICSVLMYLCDQLIDLQNRIRVLKYSVIDERSMRKKFKKIVKKHVRLMGYYKSMNTIFKEFFLIQNMAVTAELCLNAMMISVIGLDDKKLLANFLAYLIVALIIAYIYCYLGNELILQSEGIALAAYESTWTSWPVDLQRDLLTVIKVAQKPFVLSAGGFAPMTIKTFAQALYNGYSIFAVLNDVVD